VTTGAGNPLWRADGRGFDRLFIACVTPFAHGSYEVDEEALATLLREFTQPRHVEAGIGIIINPEAGECYYLSPEEKRRNVEIAVEICDERVPVMAGAIAATTKDTVRAAMDAKDAGADGIFVLPPIGAMDVTITWDAQRYPEVWIDMVKAVDEAVDLPLIAHPVSLYRAPYGAGFPPEATLKMCQEIENIVGWKMTYNWEGWKQVADGLRSLDRHVAVLGAAARCFHEALACDIFDGAATGSFNYALEPMLDHLETYRSGDHGGALERWNGGLRQLHAYVGNDASRLHVRYKAATWLAGKIPHPLMCPPMPRPSREELRVLRELLERVGVQVLDEAYVRQAAETMQLGLA